MAKIHGGETGEKRFAPIDAFPFFALRSLASSCDYCSPRLQLH
jgi:hypothetical protein